MPSQTKPEPQTSALVTIQEAFDRDANGIANLLARDGDVARLRELFLDVVSKDAKLLGCTPVSLIRAVRDMAKLNLEPVLGEAYLVPFWNRNAPTGKHAKNGDPILGAYEATLIIGYHGLQTLAFNSGFVTLIEGDVVRANDEFTYVRGFPDSVLRHVPASGDRGEIKGAWAMVWLRGADRPLIGYLEESRIEQRRLVSRSASDDNGNPKGIWREWREEMDLKTVLRFTLNLAPKSVRARVASALDLEDAVDSLLQAAPERPRLEDGEGKSGARRRRIMGRLTGGPAAEEIEGDSKEVDPASDAPGAAETPSAPSGAPEEENAAGRPAPGGRAEAGTYDLCGAAKPAPAETDEADDLRAVMPTCNLRAGHLDEKGAPQRHMVLEAGQAVETWPA